jgi:hypothetical protein
MEDQVKLQEQAIDEIIKRYGDTIDLKKSPYLIVEIVKQFQNLIGEGAVAVCQPPGGPPPKRDSYLVLFDQILTEMSQLSASVEQLHRKIDNR